MTDVAELPHGRVEGADNVEEVARFLVQFADPVLGEPVEDCLPKLDASGLCHL